MTTLSVKPIASFFSPLSPVPRRGRWTATSMPTVSLGGPVHKWQMSQKHRSSLYIMYKQTG